MNCPYQISWIAIASESYLNSATPKSEGSFLCHHHQDGECDNISLYSLTTPHGTKYFTRRGDSLSPPPIFREHSAGLDAATGELSRFRRTNVRCLGTPPPLSTQIRPLPTAKNCPVRAVGPTADGKNICQRYLGDRRC